MDALAPDQIAEHLAGPHQAVLAVARKGKGPLAIPMSYGFDGARFVMVTSPETIHGRLMQRYGRATLTVQFEACDGRSVHQWYVTAEGPVQFTEEDPAPHIRAIMAKDRGAAHADEWFSGQAPPEVRVAELKPETLIGREYRAALD